MIVKLIRTVSTEKGTFGELICNDIPLCNTLELPWKNNQQNISCIPPGKYKVKRHKSQSKGNVFWLQNVKDRTYVYIHTGNWTHEILGCILVGTSHTKNGLYQSTLAMNKIKKILPDEFELEIFDAIF